MKISNNIGDEASDSRVDLVVLLHSHVDAAVLAAGVGLRAAALALVEIEVEVGVVGGAAHAHVRIAVVVGSGVAAVLQPRVVLLLGRVVLSVVGHVGGDQVSSLRTGYVEGLALLGGIIVVEANRAVLEVRIAELC